MCMRKYQWTDQMKNITIIQYPQSMAAHQMRYGCVEWQVQQIPLSNGQLDDNLTNLKYSGVDPGGPSPFGQTDNTVFIEPAKLTRTKGAIEFLLGI